jgi:hypothetical protein
MDVPKQHRAMQPSTARGSSPTLEPFVGEDHHGDNQGDPKEYEEHNSE